MTTDFKSSRLRSVNYT